MYENSLQHYGVKGMKWRFKQAGASSNEIVGAVRHNQATQSQSDARKAKSQSLSKKQKLKTKSVSVDGSKTLSQLSSHAVEAGEHVLNTLFSSPTDIQRQRAKERYNRARALSTGR